MLMLDGGQAAQGQAWWPFCSRKSLSVAAVSSPCSVSRTVVSWGGAYTQPIKFGAQQESSVAV